jgi:hypothetical protein
MAKRSRLFTATCIGCALLIASPSWAALVEPGLGDLTINKGQGFKPVKSSITANVGDSVMVGPSGSATVVYEDGCKVNVGPGAVTTIAPLSPCASGANAQDNRPECRPDNPNRPAYCTGTADTLWLTLLLFLGFAGGIGYLVSTVHGAQAAPASP